MKVSSFPEVIVNKDMTELKRRDLYRQNLERVRAIDSALARALRINAADADTPSDAEILFREAQRRSQ